MVHGGLTHASRVVVILTQMVGSTRCLRKRPKSIMPIASVNLTPPMPACHTLADHVWVWPAGCDARLAWREWAKDTAAWLQKAGASPRDAVVTLPVGAVLSLARQGWADEVGGWLPQIDTIAGLAAALSWDRSTPTLSEGAAAQFGAAITLDALVDRMQAARSLGQQTWARQWAARDRRGHEHALAQVVDAAQTWVRALQSVPPARRPEQVDAWRAQMQAHVGQQGAAGPGGRERLLLSWALEWAAATADAGLGMDAVYGLRPSAWVAVTAGTGVMPASEVALMLSAARWAAGSGVPSRWVAAEAASSCQAADVSLKVSVTSCRDALDEARQAAAQVIDAVNQRRREQGGRRDAEVPPVALLALDRSVVRHARALLDESGLKMADETGWRLSTTRAASVCSRLVSAANPRASTDDLLDWLKSGWIRMESPGDSLFPADATAATGALEVWCRRHGLLSAWGLITDLPVPPDDAAGAASPSRHQRMGDEARVLLLWARQALAPLQDLWGATRPTLLQWLQGVRDALVRSGAAEGLRADPAGALAWSTLRLDALESEPGVETEPLAALGPLYRATRLDGAGFLRWLGEALEAVTYRPEADGAQPDVVITTLARAVLRPFHTVVMPGADERQLGALVAPSGWLGVRLREDMGLVTPAQARQAQWEAFQLVMTRSRVLALHRKAQGSEPLEASAWLSRWTDATGVGLLPLADVRPVRVLTAQPTRMPRPSLLGAPLSLPTQVSATNCDVLRQCPYRFFATVLLKLQSHDELEEGVARSDHGTWLHEVLRRFHAQRERETARRDTSADVAAWLEAAQQAASDLGLMGAGQRAFFQPYLAALPDLARTYVAWLQGHESQGWSLRACEVSRSHELDLGEGLRLKLVGQLDRVDVRHRDGEEIAFVIDYKTGNAVSLKQRAASGAEDTQLAFYAALSPGHHDVQAAYVHLDARKVQSLTHPDVLESAATLLDGLAHDWRRLALGAPMPALGEGSACTHCTVRGLCRRDHWALDEEASA